MGYVTPWTPGPWEVDGTNDNNIYALSSTGHHDWLVAQVWAHKDARLISLAPEMAELLEDFTSEQDYDYGTEPYWAVLVRISDRARDLLARARGET